MTIANNRPDLFIDDLDNYYEPEVRADYSADWNTATPVRLILAEYDILADTVDLTTPFGPDAPVDPSIFDFAA